MYTASTADFEGAAHLLLDIAGPAPAHIEMSRAGPKKYYTVARALTLDDARDHLCGRRTLGALCSRPDGQARALAYDADTPEHWQLLQQAARQLAEAGYKPLLEPSPRGRGGHLWLIYTALVDGLAARSAAHAIAPQLAQIAEYWPGLPEVTGWNRVRLPAGRYVAPGFSAWCHLYDAHGTLLARHGLGAAFILLDMQTPTEVVPALPPDHLRERDGTGTVTTPGPAPSRDRWPTVTPGPTQATKRYQPLLRNEAPQGNRFLWFRYSAAQLAAWFNERHSLEALHPREHRGMAFSPSVSERTPSTAYWDNEHGERWPDLVPGHAGKTDARTAAMHWNCMYGCREGRKAAFCVS